MNHSRRIMRLGIFLQKKFAKFILKLLEIKNISLPLYRIQQGTPLTAN